MIRISTVETFHFCPNPLFFSLLWYQLIVFSNENISVLSFKIILQDYVNLEIIKQRGSNINPDIHHSKVPSSQLKTFEWDILNPDWLINLEINKRMRSNNVIDIHRSKVFSSVQLTYWNDNKLKKIYTHWKQYLYFTNL